MEESQKNRICAFFSAAMILLGFNAVERIGAEAKKLGDSKAWIVTDEGVVKAGLVDRIDSRITEFPKKASPNW